MPWNGTGTYTRAIPSWNNDAVSGLTISSTKFDTEDNDFAAGIQNCLTRDGQSIPLTAITLHWPCALNLVYSGASLAFAVNGVDGTPDKGTFTGVLTGGGAGGGTANVNLGWARIGRNVRIYKVDTTLVTVTVGTGTPTLTLTGVPVALQPARNTDLGMVQGSELGTGFRWGATLSTSGQITFGELVQSGGKLQLNVTGFPTSGAVGISDLNVAYQLD